MTKAPTGEWVQGSVGLPSEIGDLVQSISSLIDAMLSMLNISRTILDIARTFVIGELDVLTGIISAIIAEIEGYIGDLGAIGIYVSGDFKLVWPLDNLRGGYPSYERRMVSRLTNRNDPTRPNFSASEQVAAIFLYASADPSAVQALINIMGKITKFLGQGEFKPRTLPRALPLDVLYGTRSTVLGYWGSLAEVLERGDTPEMANVRWRVAAPSNAGTVSWPLPPPSGFLIEVSTLKDGIAVAWDGPAENATMDAEGVQNRTFGLVVGPNQRPFRLYGGASVFQEDADLKWGGSGDTYTSPAVSDGEPKPGGLRTYGFLSSADSTPIPLASLYRDGKYLLQRAFYLDTSNIKARFAPGQPFTFKIAYADMPYGATFDLNSDGSVVVTPDSAPARDVFVRITAVTEAVTPTRGEPLTTSFSWTLSPEDVTRGQTKGVVALSTTMDAGSLGDPSVAVPITFPSATAGAVLNTLATALAVLVLSRSDLVVPEDGTFGPERGGTLTGMENLSYLYPDLLLTQEVGRYFKKDSLSPLEFRRTLRRRCLTLADKILSQLGTLSDTTMKVILDSSRVDVVGGKPLYAITWRDLDVRGPDITILESLNINGGGGSLSVGVALNPLANGVDTVAKTLTRLRPEYSGSIIGIALERSPGFLVRSDTPGFGAASADYSPVLYDYDVFPNYMAFCRNIFFAQPSVYAAAQQVLGIWTGSLQARAVGDGEWSTIRFVAQGVPDLEAFLKTLANFVGDVGQGVRASTEMVIGYIEFLESRILELEGILVRLDALLAYLTSIEIPSVNLLVVTGVGTDGILQEFVLAENKPIDAADSYGAGVAIVAGGLPTVLVELLTLFFPKAD